MQDSVISCVILQNVDAVEEDGALKNVKPESLFMTLHLAYAQQAQSEATFTQFIGSISKMLLHSTLVLGFLAISLIKLKKNNNLKLHRKKLKTNSHKKKIFVSPGSAKHEPWPSLLLSCLK